MDLRPIRSSPTSPEVEAVASVLGELPVSEGLAEIQAARRHLLPALHALNAAIGWISPGGLGEICRRLSIPPAEAYGVASFYSLFSMSPRPARVVHVCEDVVCKTRGSDALISALEQVAGPAGEEAGGATWLKSPCLGLCEQAPAAMLTEAGSEHTERAWGEATISQVQRALSTGAAPDQITGTPQQPASDLRLLRRIGAVDPSSLAAYRATGGYEALRRAVELGPAGVIREVTESRLMGRGGAAFPTGRKWASVAAQPVRPHWLVCNADESEPGTFKDRVLMEGDPYRLIEAMTIAGYATATERGILYIRGEYPLATSRLRHAIAECRRRGLLGPDVMGRGFSFDIELIQGAGAYICGEETALFASIEGQRGEPRSKPPFPVEVGLFGQPTLVNNVETLANIPDIVLSGGAAFASIGTPGSTGTRLFCLSGHVARPGLYEVPFGTRLSELIALAGGPTGEVQAVLLGGAAGTFLTPDELDVRLSFEDTRAIGATLGSGVVVLFDESVAMMPMLQRLAAFFRDESCGQCTPCRVGTVRQEELLARVSRGAPLGSIQTEQGLLTELGMVMRDASICGLGQTASSAVESALGKLPHLWGGSHEQA